MSFSWTTRGLSPAWIERMPSTISARECSSAWESCLQAGGDRQVDDVRGGDAEQRRDEGGGDRRAERLGLVEVAEHVDEAEDGADDAHRRGVAAGLVERLHSRRVALAHGVVLGLEDVGDEVGVGAVDDELQALLGVRVLDRAGDLVEGQQAVAARGLGVADELDDLGVEVRRLGVERLHVELRDALDRVEARAHDAGAERAAEHDQHRGRVQDRQGVRALHGRSEIEAGDRDDQADDGRDLHRSLSSWCGGSADGRVDEGQRGFAAATGGAGDGRGEDRRAPRLDGGDDVLGGVGDQHLLMRGERQHRVRRRIDGDDQVGVEVEDLSPRG